MTETASAPRSPTPPPANPEGSLGTGIAIAWACLIGGYIAVTFIDGAIFSVSNSDAAATLAILSTLLPWIAMLVLAIRFARQGKPRTAKGIGLGAASIVGVLLLLIAACFGLLSSTNFH